MSDSPFVTIMSMTLDNLLATQYDVLLILPISVLALTVPAAHDGHMEMSSENTPTVVVENAPPALSRLIQ